MLRPVSPARPIAALLTLAVLGVAGCTDEPAGSSPSPGASATAPPTEDVPRQVKGQYTYQNAGLYANVRFAPDGGATLVIRNDTGRTLPRPGLYVQHAATGREIDGRVLNAAPIPDGEVGTFDVAFPPEVRPDTIGLLILLIGPDNYGAFVPPAAG
jgi:hypothetical protein